MDDIQQTHPTFSTPINVMYTCEIIERTDQLLKKTTKF